MKIKSHYIQVSELHNIHYQTIGHEKDPPLILIHGGPGVGCTENDLRFVAGIKVKAILIDQRGCGKSTPKGSIAENSTQNLIDDIICIMDFLNIPKANILGGSWGSTLAILFTMQHQDRVENLLIRGLFMATKKSWDSYNDQTTKAFKKLKSYISEDCNGTIWECYYDKLINSNTPDQEKFVRYFAEYNIEKITEGKATSLEPNVDIKEVLAINRIRLHYMVNDFFIEDNYIWNNISTLQNIPITIIHGKYDEICDPSAVEKFSNLLPHTTVLWVKSGHSPKENALVKGVRMAISNLL